jgi:hypothetical protein
LQKGANLKIINGDNYTPLSLALKISNTDIYKIIVEEHNKQAKIENENVNNLLNDSNNKEGISTNINIHNTSNKNKKKDRKFIKEDVGNVEAVKGDIVTSYTEKEDIIIDMPVKNLNFTHGANVAKCSSDDNSDGKTKSNDNTVKDCSKKTQTGILNRNNPNTNLNFNRKKKSLKNELITYLKAKRKENIFKSCQIDEDRKENSKDKINFPENEIINYNLKNKTIEASNNLHLSIQIPFEFKEKVNNSKQLGSFISNQKTIYL